MKTKEELNALKNEVEHVCQRDGFIVTLGAQKYPGRRSSNATGVLKILIV